MEMMSRLSQSKGHLKSAPTDDSVPVYVFIKSYGNQSL